MLLAASIASPLLPVASANEGTRRVAKNNEENYVTDLRRHYFSSFSYNSFEAVKTLIEYNADPSLKDADGATPLHFAARHGCVETSTLLLSNSLSSVNCPDNSGMTPFHLACSRGSLELCELFLEHGADIRARTVEEENLSASSCIAWRPRYRTAFN